MKPSKRTRTDDWPAVAVAIGNRVRVAREALDLTQEALAEKSGLSRVTISQLEHGYRRRVNPEVLRAIATATEQDETYFYAMYTPNDGLVRFAEGVDLSPQLGALLPRLASLPPTEQSRLTALLEQMLDWFHAASGLASSAPKRTSDL